VNNTKLSVSQVLTLAELKYMQTGVMAFVGSTLRTESSKMWNFHGINKGKVIQIISGGDFFYLFSLVCSP